MSTEPSGDRHINIQVSPEMMAGVYSNFANVSHSEIPGIIVSRVSLSPRFMRELMTALEDNYSRWDAREGIKSLPEFEASDGEPEE
jgi:hypothetical protein